MTAAHRAFGVLEIFEEILSWLPPQDLLLHCTAVCRAWRTTITTSKHIATFSYNYAWILRYEPFGGRRSDYKIAAIVPAAEAKAVLQERRDKIAQPARLNTSLLEPNRECWQATDITLRAAVGESTTLVLQGQPPVFPSDEIQQQKLLTDPPVKTVDLSVFTMIKSNKRLLVQGLAQRPEESALSSFTTIENEEGVRYQDLVPFLRSLANDEPIVKILLTSRGWYSRVEESGGKRRGKSLEQSGLPPSNLFLSKKGPCLFPRSAAMPRWLEINHLAGRGQMERSSTAL